LDAALHRYDTRGVAAFQRGIIVMTGQMIEEIRDAVKLHGGRLIDTLYNSSVVSTISFGAVLLMLLILGLAISFNVIHVPVFHPDIPVTSGH
jgi:hypothetical protein